MSPHRSDRHAARIGVRPAALHIGFALALICAPALALKDDEKQPLQIEADDVALDEAKSTSVYTGNVQVDQGSMRLLARHVTVYHREDRRPRFIIALGEPAKFKQLLDNDEGEVQAFAKRIEYDAEKDELTLIEDALVIQGEDRISSDRIVYDRAQARVRAGGSGRVRITITPESQ